MEEKQMMEYQRTVLRLKIEKFIFCQLKMDYMPELKGNVYIYGAGKVGKLLLRCFEIPPTAFIDAKRNLGDICGIPVWCADDISEGQFEENDTVIVTPIWAYEEIRDKLLEIKADLNVISIEKLLERL